MRRALELPSECCCDCFVWTCCCWCASCEEARELKFRHVDTTEEYLDKSQEVCVKRWTSGVNMNFAIGDRVSHPYRGPGYVIMVMPDGRRVVSYDSGGVHTYRPGKSLWRFRLAKRDSECAQDAFVCCTPTYQLKPVNTELLCGSKQLSSGDRVVQNLRGSGTVVEVKRDGKVLVAFDEAPGEDEESEALIVPGNDPQMSRITEFNLFPWSCFCCSSFNERPNTVGAIDGHFADDEQVQVLRSAENQQKAALMDLTDDEDDGDAPTPAPKEKKKKSSWFKVKEEVLAVEPTRYNSTTEIILEIRTAVEGGDYAEAARLKIKLIKYTSENHTSAEGPIVKKEQMEHELKKALGAEDYYTADVLKQSIKDLDLQIKSDQEAFNNKFTPDALDDPENAKAFLDQMLQGSEVPTSPVKGEKEKKKKREKEIDPETGEVIKKKREKEIDPETGEVIKKKREKEIDPETGEVIKKKKKEKEIDPETGEVIKKKKKKHAADGETEPDHDES
jgi:hypothetical protein